MPTTLALIVPGILIAVAGGWLIFRALRQTAQHGSSLAGTGLSRQSSPFRSVLIREADVFASNKEGLFRAAKADQQWRRLSIPERMPTNGFFVMQPENKTEILYFIPGVEDGNQRVKNEFTAKVHGLYSSRDNGANWQLLNREYDFRHVHLHNSVLYAIVEMQFEIESTPPPGGKPTEQKKSRRFGISQRILMSRDAGRSWREITGSLAKGIQLFGIFPDPDHSNLICVNAWGTRGYVLQAPDENYHWEMLAENVWREAHDSEETFFARAYGTQSTLYMHRATPQNYFQYNFGADVDLPAFTIVPEQPTYTFPRDGEKTIRATITFLPVGPTVKLLDIDDGLHCWSLRVMDAQGHRFATTQPSAFTAAGQPATTQYQFHDVSSKQRYTRAIDLGTLFPFAEPGVYQAQLVYDNKRMADRMKGKWSGFFSGQVFTVTIE